MVVQEIVDKAEVPADVRKLPGKIDKFSFDGFTADELIRTSLFYFQCILYMVFYLNETWNAYENLSLHVPICVTE